MSILHKLGLGSRTLIMGVLNVTPDSFYDGGLYASVEAAVAHALAMLDDGADIVDIGGESTRPATFRDESPLDPTEETARIVPVIRRIAELRPGVCISVDTYKASVAAAALEAGASVLNDISGLGFDPRMAELAASTGAPIVLMHMPGTPRRLPDNPAYGDLMADVGAYFQERIEIARAAGILDEQIVLDPGIGFGKNVEQNAELIRRLPELRSMGFPVLSAPSRKSFLGKLLGDVPPGERLEGTAAAIALSIHGGADIVRVHDVRFMTRMARVCDAILRPRASSKPC
jgi:dihydropteroate synthase